MRPSTLSYVSQDMPALDELYTQVESYPKMTMEYLLVSVPAFDPQTPSRYGFPPVLLRWQRVAGRVPARGSLLHKSTRLYCLVWQQD